MKTHLKSIVALVATLACLSIPAKAQTITGLPEDTVTMTKIGGRYVKAIKPAPPLVDGCPVKIAWEFPAAALDVTAEVSIVGLVNGQESWGYNLAKGDKNPSSGTFKWTPRVLRQSGESYKVRITWKNAFGEVVTTATSKVFKISLPAPRSITMTEPLNLPTPWIVSRGTSTWIRWNSSGLPANAQIECWLQPYDNSEAGGIKIAESSDTGGQKWDISGDLTPGKYFLTIFYVTEYGVFGAESNVAIVDVQ